MKKDKKKAKKERRILVAALLVAAVTIAGSTFAWFSSQDEVTNRLSASADYGVSIAEDFTPPENWVPGQTVDKNVGVVNTGNVDAFVRTWLEGEMRLLNQTESQTAATAMANASLSEVTDEQLLAANLTYKLGDYYLKELSQDTIQNPATQTQNASSPEAYSDVMAVQAGGELALVTLASGTTTSYKFTPNQAINLVDQDGKQYQLAQGTEYTVTINPSAAKDIAVAGTDVTLKDVSYFRTIDSNSFVPLTDGLYIFRRNVNLDSPTSDDYEFSGYYVKTINQVKHYFALEYDNTDNRSEYVLPDSAITVTKSAEKYEAANAGVKMFTAQQNTIENSALNWTYDSANNLMKVSNAATGGVIINIALDNIGATAEQWTAKGTGATTTFYYNNDLEEGATTSQFITSVAMDSSVDQNDYIAFDFDLNVNMESVQVTIDSNGNEAFETVNAWTATNNGTSDVNTGATGGRGTVTAGEIELIAWS